MAESTRIFISIINEAVEELAMASTLLSAMQMQDKLHINDPQVLYSMKEFITNPSQGLAIEVLFYAKKVR